MEAVKTQTMHVVETKTLSSSILSSTKECDDTDEITPEMEDQLLGDQLSEDQVLEDEDDAQSEGSIRLRYSDDDDNDDDDDSADKISRTSEPVNNNQQKSINENTVNESSVLTPDENSLNKSIYTNGINSILNGDDKTDFTEDDTLLGNNFCDNDENGLVSVTEIIDKTITLNQFPQSAYDNSWRLGGKSRKRRTNHRKFLSVSNSNQSQNICVLPDRLTLSLNYFNKRHTYGRSKNPAKVHVTPSYLDMCYNFADKTKTPPSRYLPKVFPPSPKIKKIEKINNVIVEEKVDNNTNDKKLENVDLIIKNDTKNNKPDSEDGKLSDKDSGEGTDESSGSSQVENQANNILDSKNVDKLVFENTITTVSDDGDVRNHDKHDIIVVNGVKKPTVLYNIENKSDSINEKCVTKSIESDITTRAEPMTDESSDSGIVSTSTSIITNDDISKDDSEELKEQIIITDDEQPPKLSSEVSLEPTIKNNKTELIIDIENNKNNNDAKVMEIDDDNNKKIIETNENKEKLIVLKENCADSTEIISGNLVKTDNCKQTEIVIDKLKSAGPMEIVELDDCSEKAIEPMVKCKDDNKEELLIEANSKSPRAPKLDIMVDDKESVDISNHEISVLDQNQSDSIQEISSKTIGSKRKRRLNLSIDDSPEPEKENVRLRVKRETAQKAEVLIRKDFQDTDEDSDSSNPDIINKSDVKIKSSSLTSLKRNCEDNINTATVKRIKRDILNRQSIESKPATAKATNGARPFENLRKIFMRDSKQKLANLRQEDLEELLIQKIIETITMRDEIGKLREQAKLSERAKELSQQKCASLAKQIKDFEMIMNRYASDREKNPETYVAPIKINRSVGLQVNFLTDRGVQNLRQVNKSLQNTTQKTAINRLSQNPSTQITAGGSGNGNGNSNVISVSTTITSLQSDDSAGQTRKGLKVRSPRRIDTHPQSQVITNIQNHIPNQMHIINSISAPIVVPKVNDTRISIVPTSNTMTPVISNASVIVNGNVSSPQYRQARITSTQNRTNNTDNLIDLTEEEEKTKISSCPPALTALVTPVTTSTNLPKNQQRQPRIITNTSSNVTLAQPGIRVMTGQPTPTGLMNNMNAQRFIFMQQGGSPSRQVILTSAANSTRPIAPNSRNSFINITPSGIQTLPKGTPLRVMPTSNTTMQLIKHPAPLPNVTNYTTNPGWKMPPSAPSLKISKVTHGIVLSWNMSVTDKYAEIASYQLYAYQEIATTPPNSNLWKKVGDVRALPLPMACTLTQFLEGNNYYFAVRAVDCHGRLGEFSQPGNITL